MVEARGRTGRKPTTSEIKATKNKKQPRPRVNRLDKPPTLKGSAKKAGFMAALLFAFTQLGTHIGAIQKPIPVLNAAVLCLVAFALYTAMAYMTDNAMHKWRKRRLAQAKASAKGK